MKIVKLYLQSRIAFLILRLFFRNIVSSIDDFGSKRESHRYLACGVALYDDSHVPQLGRKSINLPSSQCKLMTNWLLLLYLNRTIFNFSWSRGAEFTCSSTSKSKPSRKIENVVSSKTMGTTGDPIEKLRNLMIFASLVALVQMLDGKGIPQIVDMVLSNHWIVDGHKNSTRR